MKSVSICHAIGDRERALDLARFIDANFGFDVSLNDAIVDPESDILAATERALSANFAIVLVSPASFPTPLRRDQWDRAFLKAPAEYETPLAFALLRECPFPDLLRRSRFFDGSGDWLECMRRLKRWILSNGRKDEPGPDHASHSAWPEVVDRPGIMEDADEVLAALLVRDARHDFEQVIRIRCGVRRLEVILGDLGRALGLKLRGPLEEDRRAIEWSILGRRCLIVFDGVTEEMKESLRFRGKSSVLLTSARQPAAPAIRPEEIAIGNISDAIEYALHAIPADPEQGGRLAARIVSVLSDYGNFTEAALVLDAVLRHIPARAAWARRELDWIHEKWGESVDIPPPPIVNAMQLDLFGDDGSPGDKQWIAA